MKRFWKGIIVGVLIGATVGWFLGLFFATPFWPKWLDYVVFLVWPMKVFVRFLCIVFISCNDFYWTLKLMRVVNVIFCGLFGGIVAWVIMERKKIFGKS